MCLLARVATCCVSWRPLTPNPNLLSTTPHPPSLGPGAQGPNPPPYLLTPSARRPVPVPNHNGNQCKQVGVHIRRVPIRAGNRNLHTQDRVRVFANTRKYSHVDAAASNLFWYASSILILWALGMYEQTASFSSSTRSHHAPRRSPSMTRFLSRFVSIP